MRVVRVKARYVHGTGRNTQMFHIINLDQVRTWRTHNYTKDNGEGWVILVLHTACGTRASMTSTPNLHDSMTLAINPPKGLRPCPRCFQRWEALGKPLTADQWRDNVKTLRVMTGHANRAKARGNQR